MIAELQDFPEKEPISVGEMAYNQEHTQKSETQTHTMDTQFLAKGKHCSLVGRKVYQRSRGSMHSSKTDLTEASGGGHTKMLLYLNDISL